MIITNHSTKYDDLNWLEYVGVLPPSHSLDLEVVGHLDVVEVLGGAPSTIVDILRC